MADCFIMRHCDPESKPKTIYNLPLQEDLNDISGYKRISVYSGDTTQTITGDGLYLYNGRVSLDSGFFDDVIDGCFTIELDIKINSIGTSKYPYYRRAITGINTKTLFLEIDYNNNISTNKFRLAESGSTIISTTANPYADENYHHLIMQWNMPAHVVIVTLDGNDYASVISSDSFSSLSLYLGDSTYGLNGYIKNFIITTG